MSKILYVNGKRVVIDEEKAYFPFTYTISDLENVNAIGIPQSKAFDIPRVPENDEIFGYIGEITRTSFNLDGNEKVGVSFNQTKKGKYELYNESELVSSGQIQVKSATDLKYSVVLYDDLVDLLEQFEGNSDTDKSFLSDLDLFKADNTIFSEKTNALLVKNLNNSSVDIIPTFNIKQYDTTGTEIRCSVQTSGGSYTMGNITLPTEMTPIQTRSVKNYEVEYNIPLNTVVRCINKYKLDDTINYNLLKGTTDAWTNSIIVDGEDYAYLSSDITKEQLGLEIGNTYTVSLTAKNFSSGQYYIGLEINNTGTISTIYGDAVTNNTLSFINFTVGDLFTSMRIIVNNNSWPVLGDTTINYKELKIEEGVIPTKWILNREEEGYGFNYVQVDSELNGLFNEVHLNCGSPKKEESDIIEKTTELDDLSVINLNAYFDIMINSNPNANVTRTLLNSGVMPEIKNGKYKLSLTIDGEYSPLFTTPSNLILTRYNNTSYVHPAYSASAGESVVRCTPGLKIGELLYGLSISAYSNVTKKIETVRIKNNLPLIYQVNTFETLVLNKVTKINTSHTVQIDFELYPEFSDIEYDSIKLGFFWDNMLDNMNFFIGTKSSFYNYKLDFTIKDLNLNYISNEIRTNNIIDGKVIFPKVSIKDFLINACKLFNLDIVNKEGSLLIRNKKYFISDEILVIDKVNEIETNLFDFNKLILTTDITDNDLFTDYEKNTKQKYGQQVINTGFNIKNKIKDVNIPISIPALMYDVNGFAYGNFTNYYNAGKSKGRYGVTNGFENKLSFNYLNRIDNDTLYVTNDTYFEGGIWSSDEPDNYPTEINFIMNNRMLEFNTDGTFRFNTNLTSDNSQSIRMTSYYTSSPYKFNSDGIIIKSLEMNRPKYNYAGLTDITYPLASTLFYTYHRNLLIDKYNVDTHILNCDLFCYNVPNVNGIYNIKNSNYIISELGEYDPTTSGSIFTGVKLMKVNDVNNYGLLDVYSLGIQQNVTFNGNVLQYADKLLGFNYNINSSSVLSGSTDNFNLLSNKNFNNSSVSLIYDNDLDITKLIQNDTTTVGIDESKTNKFNVSNTVFKYLSDSIESNFYLGNYNDTSVTINSISSTGTLTDDITSSSLYLETGGKKIEQALISDPVKANLNCIQSGGLYYWLLDGEVYLSLTNSIIDLTSASKFKFDNIVIEAKEQVSDIDYTDFQWGHSDLLDVNYEYLGDGRLKFTFKAMLFQGSNYTGTLADNVRDMYVVPFPNSDYTVKISLDGTYTDTINSLDTEFINFGTVGSNLTYYLTEFTGNNEVSTVLDVVNYKVDYSYNKI